MNKTTKVPPKQRLTAERIRRRWTQLEVADQLGTTPGNVSRWERGITSPGPYFRRKLCELFGMSAYALGLTWDGSEELLAQSQPLVGSSPTGALTQAQAPTGRDGKGSAQMAIESAPHSRGGSARVLWIKANTREVDDERLALLTGGLNRSEHGQERLAQTGTSRLHSNSDWVLVLDNVQEVRLVVDVPWRKSRSGFYPQKDHNSAHGIPKFTSCLQQEYHNAPHGAHRGCASQQAAFAS